jgi:hypothetical protein
MSRKLQMNYNRKGYGLLWIVKYAFIGPPIIRDTDLVMIGIQLLIDAIYYYSLGIINIQMSETYKE